MKKNTICLFFSLCFLNINPVSAQENKFSNIVGGLGYKFDLSWQEAVNLGFKPKIYKGQESTSTLSKLSFEDYFPIHNLVFTSKSKQLLKIEGAKFFPRDQPTNCAMGYSDALDIIKTKYAQLKQTRPYVSNGYLDSEFCEKIIPFSDNPTFNRISGYPTLGQGKCIHLQCIVPESKEPELLIIEYWNKDIYEQSQIESKEIIEAIKKERMKDINSDKF